LRYKIDFRVNFVANLKKNKKMYLVGIAGGTASGKTSILNHIQSNMPHGTVCVVSQDNYYRPLAQQTADANGIVNFDVPESIDLPHFLSDVTALLQGRSISKAEYTFDLTPATPRIITTQPCAIVIVEGLFVFNYAPIADLLHLKVFVDAHDTLRLQRRLHRDTTERGSQAADVHYRWNHHIQPSFEQYLLPYKAHAHIVLPNDHHYTQGCEVLINHLKTKING
jgi:uridine kinase